MASKLLLVIIVMSISTSELVAAQQVEKSSTGMEKTETSPEWLGLGSENGKSCWESVLNPDCVTEIGYAITHKSNNYPYTCCKAVVDISNSCLKQRLGLAVSLLQPLLKIACDNLFHSPHPPSTTTPTTTTTTTTVDFTADSPTAVAVVGGISSSLGENKQEFIQCLSNLKSVNGCIEETIMSFLTLKAGIVGPSCCKAIIQITEDCWPKILPFNPFFPPLLKDHCNRLVHSSPPNATPSLGHFK